MEMSEMGMQELTIDPKSIDSTSSQVYMYEGNMDSSQKMRGWKYNWRVHGKTSREGKLINYHSSSKKSNYH